MKICYACKTPKELPKFYKHPKMASGYHNICKECQKERSAISNENPSNRLRNLERGKVNSKKLCASLTQEGDVFRLERIYYAMINRCYYKSNKKYKIYGGRGVTVCNEWRNSKESFVKWALSSGYKKGFQLDKDIKGDGKLYSPGMCKWVTNEINSQTGEHTVIDLRIAKEIKKKLPFMTTGGIAGLYKISYSVVYSIRSNISWKNA